MAMPYIGARVPQELLQALSINTSYDVRDAFMALAQSLPKFSPAELELIRQATSPRMACTDMAPFLPLVVERAIETNQVATDGVDVESLLQRLRRLCPAEAWVLLRYLHPLRPRREARATPEVPWALAS